MAIIYTARWVIPISTPPIERGAVAFDQDRILSVGSLSNLQAQYPHAAIQDFGEAAILPGFVNTHSHLELTAFRGRLEETSFQRWIVQLIKLKRERLNADDLLNSARLGCIEAIRSGITTLGDTSDAAAPLQALIESGQRGVIFQECFGPACEQAQSSIDDLSAKLDVHREQLAQSVNDAQSRLLIGISPHAPYSVSAALYEKAAKFALDQKLDVAIHTAESRDETSLLKNKTGAFAESLTARGIEFSAPGCSTIKYFDQLGVLETSLLLIHCVTVDDQDIELIARHHARIAHCPKSNAKFGHGIAPLEKFKQAGITVGLGSDSVASNNTCDLIEEARFASLLHRSIARNAALLSPEEMLRMMTIDGARALGLDAKVGSLEATKQADLTVIDLSRVHNSPHYDPLAAIVWSCSAQNVRLTMVNGQVLYDGLRVTTIDEEAVLRNIVSVQSKLSTA